MKNVLFATTALVALAGAASADINNFTVTGSADLEASYTNKPAAGDNEWSLSSSVSVKFKGERTTNDGLTFGAYGELSATSSNPESVDTTADWEDRYVYLKSGGHALHYGDTDGAYDKAIVGLANDGLADEFMMGDSGLDGEGNSGDYVLRYDFTGDLGFGKATVSASFERNDATNHDNIYGVGVNLDVSEFNVGLGYQKGKFAGSDTSVIGASVGAKLMGFDVRGQVEQKEVASNKALSLGASASYTMDSLTVGANVTNYNDDTDTLDWTGAGAWVSYDLGNGLSATASAAMRDAENDANDEKQFKVGLSMSF